MRDAATHYPPKVDVAVNALGRPLQTLLTIASLHKFNAAWIDKIYLIIDADTPKEQYETFKLIHQIKDIGIEFYFPAVSYNYFDNVVDCYDEHRARMGIRYQYAWENTDKKYLFITHNDCLYTGDIIRKMLEQIGRHIIIGQLGVCWNCPASWEGLCGRGRYLEYKPSYKELVALFQRAQAPAGRNLQFRCDKTDFNEKYRKNPWPLPACRVSEWACLVDMEAARPITVPWGTAVPFGATTYIGDVLLDTACEWFHDVNVLGHTAADFPVERYVQHKFGMGSMYSRIEYLKKENDALHEIKKQNLLRLP